MWHASIATHGGLTLGAATLERRARKELDGLGDPTIGEWGSTRNQAYHLRRRLNTREATAVGPVIDIRNTAEADRRLNPVRHLLPPTWAET